MQVWAEHPTHGLHVSAELRDNFKVSSVFPTPEATDANMIRSFKQTIRAFDMVYSRWVSMSPSDAVKKEAKLPKTKRELRRLLLSHGSSVVCRVRKGSQGQPEPCS